jgi:hypothetical protein
MDADLRRELQTERIDGRKNRARYVELKAAMHREHVARIEAELAPIQDDLLRHDGSREDVRQSVSNAS